MTLADIKAEPLAVWDVREREGLYCQHLVEAGNWAERHIEDCHFAYRVEFHLLDAPCAVVWRYKRNEDRRRFLDRETGEIAMEPPVVQMLDEMPPAHLLGRWP